MFLVLLTCCSHVLLVQTTCNVSLTPALAAHKLLVSSIVQVLSARLSACPRDLLAAVMHLSLIEIFALQSGPMGRAAPGGLPGLSAILVGVNIQGSLCTARAWLWARRCRQLNLLGISFGVSETGTAPPHRLILSLSLLNAPT